MTHTHPLLQKPVLEASVTLLQMVYYSHIRTHCLSGAGAGGEGGAAADGSAVGGDNAFEQMTAAAQSMMKDFLKPDKLQELATR